MIEDISRRLVANGIEIPAADPVPGGPDGVPWLTFPSAGADAVAWWRRLRRISQHTGLWPLLVDRDLASYRWPEPVGAGTPGQRVERAAAVDPVAVLNSGGMTLDALDERQRRDMLDGWPDDPVRIGRPRAPFARDGQARPVSVTLVAAEHGWHLPALLGFGGWNACPRPEVHSAVLRYWQQEYGTELVYLGDSSMELAVARPPGTPLDALGFAWEYAAGAPTVWTPCTRPTMSWAWPAA
jgi:hypothetical protein